MTKYTDFVKALAAEKGITYKEAMAEAKGLYKKEVESPKSVVEVVKVEEVKEEEKPKTGLIMEGCVAQGFPEPLNYDPIIHIVLDALPGSGKIVVKKPRKVRAKSISVA